MRMIRVSAAIAGVLATTLDLSNAEAIPMRIGGIGGACSLSVAGKARICKGVIYMEFPRTRRADFTVGQGQSGAISFSGSDLSRDEGSTTLVLDKVVETRHGRIIDHPATGRCVMQHTPKVTRIIRLDCTVEGELGATRLSIVGNGKPFELITSDK